MYEDIRKELLSMSDDKYAQSALKVCPDLDLDNVIGIRTPELRKIAKRIVKNKEFEQYISESSNYDHKYHEEIMLEGLIIGYSKIDLKEKLELINEFIPKINNWIVNDTVTSTIKVKKDNELKTLWNFILPYLKSDNQYEVRYAVKTMLDNFIIEDYVNQVILELDNIENKEYYAQMAVAWTLAEVGIKFNEKAMLYLNNDNNLDDFTYNMTLQKMIDSRRVPNNQKAILKSMKRRE